jgi:hypothetical protein
MTWKWFGVKTLYRLVAHGRPKAPDEYFSGQQTMFEERVVLLRARSFDEALRRGEQEAKAYVKPGHHENPFGQRVTLEYLKTADAFENPAAGVEVYSVTGFISRRISNEALVDAHFGVAESHLGERTKFLNREVTGREWWKEGEGD